MERGLRIKGSMIDRNLCHLGVAAVAFVVATAVSVFAQAEAERTSPYPHFTGKQLDGFAAMVGESREVVARRLYLDPDLAALAVEAAEMRAHRLRSGKTMTILGFTGLAISTAGVVLGGVIWTTDCGPMGEVDLGCGLGRLAGVVLVVAGGLGAVAGWTVGVFGIDRIRTPSPTERAALARYQIPVPAPAPTMPPSYSFARPAGASGKTFSLPLLSLAF
jgi:hypothetical protein